MRSATVVDGPENSRRLGGVDRSDAARDHHVRGGEPGFLEKQYANYSYMNGTVVFAAGLAIVRAHNRWTWSWPVVVTLTGWVAIVWGLVRMFAPEIEQGGVSVPTYIGIAIPFVVGVFLTFQGYRPPHRDADTPVASREGE